MQKIYKIQTSKMIIQLRKNKITSYRKWLSENILQMFVCKKQLLKKNVFEKKLGYEEICSTGINYTFKKHADIRMIFKHNKT